VYLNVCSKCHPACQNCEENNPGLPFVADINLDGYTRCCGKLCSNDYYKAAFRKYFLENGHFLHPGYFLGHSANAILFNNRVKWETILT